MSLVDVSIPLIAGILLAACPQIFFKRTPGTTDGEFAKKTDKLRKMGCVLLGVAALYFVLTLARA